MLLLDEKVKWLHWHVSVMAVAVYAGTFDPPTRGHLWMIRRGAEIFSKLYVVIACNPDKKTFVIPIKNRVRLMREWTDIYWLNNVEVIAISEHEYTVNAADKLGANVLIRGIRNSSDFEYEQKMSRINESINPNIQTILLPPPDTIAKISSTSVRERLGKKNWESTIRELLPRNVYSYILKNEGGLRYKMIPKYVWDTYAKRQHYHNLAHIAELLSAFYRGKWEHPDDVFYAIWYHDLVYNTKALNNEQKSVAAFLKDQSFNERIDLDNVCKLIMATDYSKPCPDDLDCRNFRTIDTNIIFSDPDTIREYEYAIRKEYSWVSEKRYYYYRRKIMKALGAPYVPYPDREQYLG